MVLRSPPRRKAPGKRLRKLHLGALRRTLYRFSILSEKQKSAGYSDALLLHFKLAEREGFEPSVPV